MGALLEPVDPAMLAKTREGMLSLSPAEYATLRVLLRGVSHTEAGAELGVSRRTSETHLLRILKKTSLNTRDQLMRLAAELDEDPQVAAYLDGLKVRHVPLWRKQKHGFGALDT